MGKEKKLPSDTIRFGRPRDLQAFSVKEVGNEEVMIEGFASTETLDRGDEIVYVDGIDIDEYLENPILLFYHKKMKPIGKVVGIEKRPEGLWVKAMISESQTPMVTYVRDLIRENILTTFSIGFKAIEEEPDFKGINHIRRSKLFEISVVALPMNKDATFRVASKELNFDDDINYKDLKTMLLKEIGDEHDVSDEGTGGTSAVNKPVENLEMVSNSDEEAQEEATPEATEKEMDQEESENEEAKADASQEEEPVEENPEEDEKPVEEDKAEENPQEEKPTDENQPPPQDKPEDAVQKDLDSETTVANFINDAEMIETGDATVIPGWVQDQELWKKARQASIDTWGDASFPFMVYAYFTSGGATTQGSPVTASDSGMDSAESDEALKKKELPDPASGQPLAQQTQNEDPHLKAAEQTNVLLGSVAALMQTMLQRLDTLCQNTQPLQTEAASTGLEQKALEELEQQISALNLKIKKIC